LCKKILLAESKLKADTERNADTEIPKELDTNLKIIWLDYQNNYVQKKIQAWWVMIQKVFIFLLDHSI